MKNKLLLGNAAALAGHIIWGLMPLYWGLLDRVSAFEIVVHRVVLSLLLLIFILLIRKKRGAFAALKDKKTRGYLIVAGVIMLVNWSAYIMAVLADRVVECSFAYYANPLIVIAFGMLFLKEPAGPAKLTAVGLALAGVLILSVGYTQFPTYALVMAISFSIYGVVKKRIQIDPYTGLFFEMLVMLPAAIGIEIWLLVTQSSVYSTGVGSVWFLLLLMLSGGLTMLPLTLYNTGLNMISLGNIGFLQFVTPTMLFFIGVYVNGEAFTTTHLISFVFIWAAVIIYCVFLALGARTKRAHG